MTDKKLKKVTGTNPSLRDVEPDYLVDAMKSVTPYLKNSKVNQNDAVAVQNRIEEYFTRCIENRSIPTFEGMALYCGVVRKTFWQWSTGKDAPYDTAIVIQKARDALAGIDAQLVLQGKINPVSYIFRSKNFYEMKDSVEVSTPTIEKHRNIEEIAKRYENVVMVDAPDQYLDNRDG